MIPNLQSINASGIAPWGANNLPACMGSFCNYRDQCGRHLTDEREYVVERLCLHGHETPEPVFVATRLHVFHVEGCPNGVGRRPAVDFSNWTNHE